MFDSLTRKITRSRLDEFVKKYASAGRTLDIGCSNSPYSKYFSDRVGLDVRPGPGIDIVGDAHRLPFGDSEFEIVLCTEVLEHLHAPAEAIAETRRVLKPGGLLILSTRFIFPLHDTPGDYFRFTKYGLKHLFRDGWEIVELKEESSAKDTIAILFQRLGYQTEVVGGRLTKALIFLAAKIIAALPDPVKKEFGGIKKENEERGIMTSGYYLACRKK